MLPLPCLLLLSAYSAAASPVVPRGQAPQPRDVPAAAVIPLSNPVYHRFNARKAKTFDAAAAKREKDKVVKKHGRHNHKRAVVQSQTESGGVDVEKRKCNGASHDASRKDIETSTDPHKENTYNSSNQKGKEDKTAQKGQQGDHKDSSKTSTDHTSQGNNAAQKGDQKDKTGGTDQINQDSNSSGAQKGDQGNNSINQKGQTDTTKSNHGAQKSGNEDTKSKSNSQTNGNDRQISLDGQDSKKKPSSFMQTGQQNNYPILSSLFLRPDGPAAGLFDVKSLRTRSEHGLERRQASNASESLVNDHGQDLAYYGPASIGTPGQDTTVLFDTGSSDLIIPLSSCIGCVGPLFKSNHSSTFQDSHVYFDIEYLDGSGSRGTVAYDAVSVAGLKVANQSFGAIRTETENSNLPSAGIMGMGFAPNAVTRETPFFFNLVADKSLASNVFSFYLSRDSVNGSELCLGCIDSSKFTGDLNWYRLETNFTGAENWWNIASDGILVNSSTLTSRDRFEAIIDSGTSLIYVPPLVADRLYTLIPDSEEAVVEIGPGFYTFPCANAERLPTVSLVFNGTAFPIDPADFNLGSADMFGKRCVGGIVGLDVGLQVPAAIVGVEFMKAWYSVFDYDGKRVGFAPAVQP